jgi:2-polyprenyl-6-methoxyphenol hydroxylase-like FAD-dependent oxidoreductase
MQFQRAIVIGGSMAGLFTAQVLSQHFQRVTVVERDRCPDQPDHRQGVPQSHHVHVLLTQGYRILEQLFPGIDAELAAAGAPQVEWTFDTQMLALGGWASPVHSALVTRPCSRTLLEWIIRQRLMKNDRVEWLQGQVMDLSTNVEKTHVTGVKLKGETETELLADLVVDASGRNSRSPEWLEKMGYGTPTETVVNSFLGYASRWYQMPEEQTDWKVLMVTSRPPHHKRGAVIYPVEGNQFVLTLAGIARDYPPTDEAGFLEFARSLRTPMVYDAICHAEARSPISSYRRTENRLRHYEKLTRFPDHFAVLGDAVCAFNPIYGQGMTTAALGALTLEQCVQQGQTGLAFQKQLSHGIANPWMMATSEDFRWESTEGGKPSWLTRLIHRYFEQILELVTERTEIYQDFAEVVHMTQSPTILFHPPIVFQVIKHLLSPRKTNASS